MSTKRKLNIDLLKRLRTRFLRMKHPEHFNMEHVAVETDCGTAMCIAGHTLDLQGYRRRKQPDSARIDFISPKGRKVSPLTAAARELGIPYRDGAFWLFHDFSLDTPKRAAGRLQEIIDNPKSARDYEGYYAN